MSNIHGFEQRIGKVAATLSPAPRLIDCSSARDELLLRLDASMSDEERSDGVTLTPAMMEEEQLMSEMLEHSITQIQAEQNVRFVSYD